MPAFISDPDLPHQGYKIKRMMFRVAFS